jgi:hypothetical protein
MSHELRTKLEKQADRIELLEEELRSTNQALEEKTEFAAGLEQDLENAIIQLQRTYVDNRIGT